MEITIPYAASQTPLTSPGPIGGNCHLPTVVRLGIVNIQLERSPFMGLDQTEKILGFMQNGVGANDEVRIAPKSGSRCGAVGLHVEYVPDVFVGALEGAETDRDSQKTLAAPCGARRDEHLTHRPRLRAVDRHRNFLLEIDLQQILQCVVVLIQPSLPDGHDEVEKGFEAGAGPRRIFLHS